MGAMEGGVSVGLWGTIEHTRKHWMEWLKLGVGMLHAVKMSAGEEMKEYIKNWVDTVAIV